MSNNKYKILIVEDESNIRNFVKTMLAACGYQVFTAKNGTEGEFLHRTHCPDLIILDLGLPDMDGVDFLKKIRKTSMIPIIVLSARTNESDKVEALDLGANDYVTKPFGTAELRARVRLALRISQQLTGSGSTYEGTFENGDLLIDYDERKVSIAGEEIKLTQNEYNIVSLLSKKVGKILTYSEIIQAVWGWNDSGSIKKLQVNMANIRKKFGFKPGDNKYIYNELGVGYCMKAERSEHPEGQQL